MLSYITHHHRRYFAKPPFTKTGLYKTHIVQINAHYSSLNIHGLLLKSSLYLTTQKRHRRRRRKNNEWYIRHAQSLNSKFHELLASRKACLPPSASPIKSIHSHGTSAIECHQQQTQSQIADHANNTELNRNHTFTNSSAKTLQYTKTTSTREEKKPRPIHAKYTYNNKKI